MNHIVQVTYKRTLKLTSFGNRVKIKIPRSCVKRTSHQIIFKSSPLIINDLFSALKETSNILDS